MNASWISAGIPPNWQVKKLRYTCSSIKTGSTPSSHFIDADSTPESVRWFTPVDFSESIYLNTSRRGIRDEAIVGGEAELFPEKSVYAVGIGSIGKVGLCKVKASANQQLNVLTPNKTTDARFLAYSLLNQADLLLALANTATLPILNQQRMGDVHIAVPSYSTQRAIADYLDRETARLDALMAAKKRVLGLLAEKRRALITRAVTCGLDPRAPLRDSGIPWLGVIPAHWVATRLKFVADVRGGITIGQRYSTTDLIEMPYLRVANVQDGRLDLTEVATVLLPRDEAAACMLAAGDVLMNEGGDADKLGRGCVWRGEIERCLHQNHVFAVRPQHVLSDWLNIWTSTDGAKAFFESRAKQSTNLASISATNIKELPIPLPPPEEQSAIIDLVKDASAKLDVMRSATERTIALLKERRAALIAAAVTGQIDVSRVPHLIDCAAQEELC